GVIPSNLVERLALWMGKVPVPMLDALFSILKARTLMAAVRFGVFEALRDGPLTAMEVAERCRLDAECTELLLRVLVITDYLEYRGGQFVLSELSRKTMIAGAEHELFGYLMWNYSQWEMMGQLEDLLRTGRGIDFHETLTDPEAWADYQRAMMEVARFSAPMVADRVPVKAGARHLLDIAGSHGLFGAAICRKHPPMTSTVLDLPAAIESARELARAEKIDDVVEHRAGDILVADYGKDNDVALLSNILHHFDEETNVQTLRRAFDSLTARGTVAIWEIEAPEKDAKPAHGDGAALYFRLTSTARCYHGSEYSRWLERVGFTDVRATRPALSPGSVLVVGRRP
ncbi:MAG TPA: methyltransferase, partial [Blastocatellia bacterium]|nr:methyltransferase [Blastocatellia bacterium]